MNQADFTYDPEKFTAPPPEMIVILIAEPRVDASQGVDGGGVGGDGGADCRGRPLGIPGIGVAS